MERGCIVGCWRSRIWIPQVGPSTLSLGPGCIGKLGCLRELTRRFLELMDTRAWEQGTSSLISKIFGLFNFFKCLRVYLSVMFIAEEGVRAFGSVKQIILQSVLLI